MQLDGGGRGGAQHILEWGVFGLVVGRNAGVLLLEDGQSQHVAAGGGRGEGHSEPSLKSSCGHLKSLEIIGALLVNVLCLFLFSL